MRRLNLFYRLAAFSLGAVLLASLAGAAFSQDRALGSGPAASPQGNSRPVQDKAEGRFARLPLAFEQNRGQTDPRVLYLGRGAGYTLFLTPDRAVFSLNGGRDASSLALRFAGAGSSPRVRAENELPGKTNYFIGRDPAEWRTNVPNFARVSYENVYPGVSVVYYGTERQLEQDWVISPGADPRRIAFELQGAHGLSIDAQGNLVAALPNSELRFGKPVVYQMADSGGRIPIDGRFVLRGRRRIGFRVGAYDRSKELVIDPELLYSTYLGGTQLDEARAIAVDSAGEAYVAGDTASTDFPVTSGVFQPTCTLDSQGICERNAFVTKLSADGSSLVFSTYLGGSGSDIAFGLALDSSGNAYLAGQTGSATNFPVKNAFQSTCNVNSTGACLNAFVSEISSTGSSLIYSTYLGGSNTNSAYGIALDSAGGVYVAGQTASTNFPVTAGVIQTECGTDGTCNTSNGVANSDAFVSKFNTAASGASSLVYSTYLGGSGVDYALGVAVDSAFNAYITGTTNSTDLKSTSGVFQPACKLDSKAVCEGEPFVAKLNSTATALGYLTYAGGSGGAGNDTGYAIALDGSDNAYVAGQTASTDFPVTSGAFQTTCGTDGLCNPVNGTPTPDAFVFKLNSSASGLTYSTYLGGSGYDFASAIALDAFGEAYVTGGSYSSDFPVANTLSCCGTLAGGEDAFVTVFNAAGNSPLVLSSYLGGAANDTGYGIALDSTPNIYVAGSTFSTNFPTLNPFQSGNMGNGDAFVSKISQVTAPAVGLSVNSVAFGNQLVGASSSPMALTVTNTGTAGLTISTLVFGGTDPGDFSETDNCLDTTIAPGSNCTVNITFKPAATGARSATLTVNSNASNGAQVANLSGTGVVPAATLSPSSLTFAAQLVNTPSAAQTVTLTNTGSAPLTIISIAASSSFSETGNCTSALGAGATCSIYVTFTPTAAGAATGSLTVTDNASSGPTQTAALTGTGITAALSVSPASLTFASQIVATTSAAQDVKVTNISTTSVSITGVTITGLNYSDFTASQCGTTLAAAATCTIAVTFHPSATGSRTASLYITSNATPSTNTVSLSGTGVEPVIALSPSSLSFASTIINTVGATKTITATNTGSATASITSISVTGTNANQFTESNNCGSTLAINASCTISVTFKPTVGGTWNASVSLADNAAGSPQTAALTGLGADFLFTIWPPGGQSVNPGMEAVYNMTITPLGGFNGPVTVACSGVPSLTTCSVSPSVITPSTGKVAVEVSVDVFTTAPSSLAPWSRRLPPIGPLGGRLLLASLGLGLATLVLLTRKRKPSLILGLALLSILAWSSCGNSTAAGGSSNQTSGTAAGTYMFSVTGTSGSLSHNVTGTLTVK
jgi:hypothetical protein